MATFINDLVKKFPWQLATNVALLVVEGLLAILSVVTIAPLIDVFLQPALAGASPITQRMASLARGLGLPPTLTGFLVLFLAAQLMKNGISLLARHALLRTKYAVLRELIVGTFEDFFRARWAFFSGSQQGLLLNTFLREVTVVGDAFGALALLCASVLQAGFYLVVPLVLSWQVTLLSLGTALVLAVPFLRLGRLSYRLGVRNTESANALGVAIQEHLSLAKVVLGFGNQRAGVERLAAAFDAHRRATLNSQTLGLAAPLMYEPLGTLVLVVALAAARRVGLSLSEIAVLLWALRNSIPSVGNFTVQRNVLANLLPSYQQLCALRAQARALRQRSGAQPFTGFREALEVKRLSVSYPDRGPALIDVSLRIPKGAMVAVVGESGAGKSTLIDAILGFHEPAAGRILIDGTPLEEFDITTYRQRIGYVPQESILFNTTIRENLRWAKPDATDRALADACRLANAEEFIRRLPQGYDTVVGDRGVRLSGGQCQRIALARAMLRRPELLILDEATSAIDSESERLIQQAIETIAKETTVIVIAHRLSTIVHADVIYVLHGGRVEETGTFQELVERQGQFSRMTQLQLLAGAR